jgi:hypothetical protein
MPPKMAFQPGRLQRRILNRRRSNAVPGGPMRTRRSLVIDAVLELPFRIVLWVRQKDASLHDVGAGHFGQRHE